MKTKVQHRAVLVPLLALSVALGCQGILGIEEGRPRLSFDGGSCLLDSHCDGNEVCLFETCSPECEADKDCASGRCLDTEVGIGCVTASQARCPDRPCPEGTVCNGGQCRSSCDATVADSCLEDQTCLDGVCVGNDPTHDPVDAGAGAGGRGAGGTSGAGGHTTTRDAAPDAADASDDGSTEAGAGGSSGTGGRGAGGSGGDSGAGGMGDPCVGMECDEPPDDECATTGTKRTYEAIGSCDEGTCEYGYADSECTFGCSNGACNLDPCTGIDCTTPPENHCRDSGHFVAYDTTGSCDDGECVFASQVVECTCVGDACTTDPCETVTCNNPPSATCFNANTRRTYAASGTCSDGSCTYAPTDTSCPHGCENGACKPDPCAGVSCTNPPIASCPDGTTLRTYVSPGSCSGGTCTYASNDTACTVMCSIDGTADCRCPSGYTGPGVGPGGCTDINECATNNGGCGNATYWKCTNNTGAPPTCSDINECSTGTHDCDTSPAAQCSNVAGGFNCTCPNPYVGNGHGASGCTCPAVPACDAANERNGSYCSNSTTLVSCAATNGCQLASTTNCRKVANELCVGAHPSAACEIAVGNHSLSGNPGTLGSALLFAVPFTLTESLTLTRIGLVASAASTGVRLAVYEGSASPTTWRASALGGTIAAGRNEYPVNDPPPSSPVTLGPGTYWIAVVVQAATQFPQGATGAVRYKPWSPWNTPFPTGSLAPITSDNLPALPFYVVGVP